MSSPGNNDVEAAPRSQADQPTEEEIRQFPWKYIGYNDLTNYIASDPDFFAVRRFDRLHTRAILTLQALLAEKEAELDELDMTEAQEQLNAHYHNDPGLAVPRDIDNGTAVGDMPQRKRLIADITQRLNMYDTLLLNYSALHTRLPRASKWNIRNLSRWLSHNRSAIAPSESSHFIDGDSTNTFSELVTLHPQKPFTRWFFEQKIVFGLFFSLFRRRWAPFNKRAHESSSAARMMSERDRREVYMYSDETIDRVPFVALRFATLAMLIVPLWILQALGDSARWKLGVITIFAIVWLAFFSFTTEKGRPFEKMAATAGYLAVLVVFLQFGEPAVTVLADGTARVER